MKNPNQLKDISNKANELANELADRPYKGIKDKPKREKSVTRKFSLDINENTLEELEDIALINKRAKLELKSVAEIVRLAIDEYLTKHNKQYKINNIY